MNPSALYVLFRYIARPDKKILQGGKEIAIEMEYVGHKMLRQGPEGFFCLYIFLAANVAIPAHYRGAAIQAVLVLTFWLVGHVNFC